MDESDRIHITNVLLCQFLKNPLIHIGVFNTYCIINRMILRSMTGSAYVTVRVSPIQSTLVWIEVNKHISNIHVYSELCSRGSEYPIGKV